MPDHSSAPFGHERQREAMGWFDREDEQVDPTVLFSHRGILELNATNGGGENRSDTVTAQSQAT